MESIPTQKIKLSPSKIKKWDQCSWLFSLAYGKDKTFPNPSGSGANKGSVTHYVLECLARKNKKNGKTSESREDYVNKIVALDDPFCIPSVQKLIKIHAKQLEVDSEADLLDIKGFILVALKNDFFCEGSIDLILEDKFYYEGRNFVLNGILDKTALYKDKVVILDYKTNKTRFSKEEMAFNYQNLIYTFAIKKKYPDLPVSMVFQFLKFKKNPNVEAPFVSDKELEGLESYLENIAEFLSDFDDAKAKSNFAKDNIKNRWLCGKLPGDMNAAGDKPAFVCPAKFPRPYFVLKDENGKFIKSDFEKKTLDKSMKPGYSIDIQFYEGCSAWKFLWEEKK